MHPDVAKARSRSAVAHRRGDAAAIIEAKRDLAVVKLEVHIESVVKGWPAPTAAQVDRLALLLRGEVA